jgi:hypothetical protein
MQHDLRFNFYESKSEEAKGRGKLILCCQLSITVVSTPPSSMVKAKFFHETTLRNYGFVLNLHFQPFVKNILCITFLRVDSEYQPEFDQFIVFGIGKI